MEKDTIANPGGIFKDFFGGDGGNVRKDLRAHGPIQHALKKANESILGVPIFWASKPTRPYKG